MKYQWLEEGKTCEDLSTKLGCHVKSMTRGNIIIGEVDGEPITKKGIEIELEGETPEILAKLDLALPFIREGGRTFLGAVQDNLDLSGSQKEAFKLSQLYGLTQEQLATYIENNVTNLVEVKAFLKKLSAVVLWLVKQSKLDD